MPSRDLTDVTLVRDDHNVDHNECDEPNYQQPHTLHIHCSQKRPRKMKKKKLSHAFYRLCTTCATMHWTDVHGRRLVFLASQDAIEVMPVTYLLTHSWLALTEMQKA